jgi:predicted nucleic acid-binding protein
MSVIIADTTPINYLVLIDHVLVLPDLYGRVIVPQAVLGELQVEGTPPKVKEWVSARPDWLEVQTLSAPLGTFLDFLDAGEREVIRLAKEVKADAIIIDEPDGRDEAKRQGLRVIGTLRVLYDAAEAGICDLEQAYERLQHTTFRAHPQLFRTFLAAYRQE